MVCHYHLTGAFVAYYLTLRQVRKWGYKEEIFENFFLLMLPIAIVGARLYYVIFEWNNLYAADPISAFIYGKVDWRFMVE